MKEIKRVYKKTVSIVSETAVYIYQNLVGENKGFLLESYDKNNGRYVFIGREPKVYITSSKNGIHIKEKNKEEIILTGNPVDLLKNYYNNFEIINNENELPFTGGLLGALGYDFVKYKENIPDNNEDEIGIETVNLMLVTEFVIIDHVAETLTAVVLEENNVEGEKRAKEKINEIILESLKKKYYEKKEFIHDGKIINKSDSLEEYCEKVNKIKEYIKEGHVFQTVLSVRWTVDTKQKGFDLYCQLRELNPSPYMYYINYGDFEIIGSSPEMIVKQKDNRIFTCPIAGTRPRGKNKEQDQQLKKELLEDEKERAEHVMLVDLARNDMGRVSEFGTVKVGEFMKVQNYSHVMHIVSLVEGKKKGEFHPFDLVNAFLPAGTLSGAPKIRAMEIIDELEEVKRGLYGGAIGYIDFNGNMDFCITIRTMIKKKNKVFLQAGAGIVYDSVPEKEYEECCNKVMALANTL